RGVCSRQVAEVGEQFNRRCTAARSILFQTTISDPCDSFGHLRPNVPQRCRVLVHERVDRRPTGLPTERPASREELVQDDPERDDVADRASTGWPSACSGDMYPLVPTTAPALV